MATVKIVAKEDEIEYLSRLGKEGTSHALNKPWSDAKRGLYLQEVGALLSVMPAPPSKLLDLGAGSGWTSCLFAMSGYSVTATDIAPDMIALQRENQKRFNVDLDDSVVCDFEDLPFVEEFDIVVFYDCLHHSDDEVVALREAYKSLKPGGICVTLEPGRGHSKTDASLAAIETMGTTERDMPPSVITRAAKKVGFSSHQIVDRPTSPVLISNKRNPSVRAILEFTKQFLVRGTPLASTRGHIVVLTKGDAPSN